MERPQKKRIIIIVICAMLAFVLAFLAVSAIAGLVSGGLGFFAGVQSNASQSNKPQKPSYKFYEADYNKNILEDPDYLSKDRLIYIYDPRSGQTTSIVDDKDRERYDPAFQLLCTMIDYIIAGNADRYNDLFSSTYYATDGNQRKERFTMQQLYAIKITVGGMTDEIDENGKKYTQYEYIVEYKIRENNGTFRDDIDSDASRREQFIISNANSKASTEFLIDQVSDYRYSYG